jgi:hypothetical protein
LLESPAAGASDRSWPGGEVQTITNVLRVVR